MEYPQRPKLFALKFARLLLGTHAATDLGQDVFTMLIAVAWAEDETGYAGPVSFFNEQAQRVTGHRSIGALIRTRDRAISTGWLRYEPGHRGSPGRYCVVVPDRYAGLLGRAAGFLPPAVEKPEGNRKESGGFLPPGEGKPEGKRKVSGRKPEGKRKETASHHIEDFPGTTLNPSLTQEIAESAERPRREISGPAPDKTAGGDQKPRPRNELFDAVAEVCGADPRLNGSQVGKAAADLARAGYTPADVRAFAARLVEFCPWAKDRPHRRPEVGELVKHIGKIRTAGRPVTAAPVPPEQQPGFDPKLGFVPTPGFKYRNPLTED